MEWSNICYSDRLLLLKDTLQGTIAIHKEGLTHRDITMRNLVIRSWSSMEAALIDYGKITEDQHSNDTLIGPKCTLAPEVWHQARYDRRIDIYSLGYAWLSTFNRNLPSTEEVDRATHQQILSLIDALLKDEKIKDEFADLLRCMLAWDPEHRISTEMALNHSCWKAASQPRSEKEQRNIQPTQQNLNPTSTKKRKSHSNKEAQIPPKPHQARSLC